MRKACNKRMVEGKPNCSTLWSKKRTAFVYESG